MVSLLIWLILGFLAGYIAKAIMPGYDGGGVIMTTFLGIIRSGGRRIYRHACRLSDDQQLRQYWAFPAELYLVRDRCPRCLICLQANIAQAPLIDLQF